MGTHTGLIAHWPLAGDCRDHSGNGHHGRNRALTSRPAAPSSTAAAPTSSFPHRPAWTWGPATSP